MASKTLLWLDDIRNPFDKDFTPYVALYNPFLNKPHTIEWVKDYDEFVSYLRHNKKPHAISFDHDLAPEHYTPEEYWNDFEKSKEFQESKQYKEKTGFDCVKFLVAFCEKTRQKLPICIYHTANPVGRENMETYINNAKKHLEL